MAIAVPTLIRPECQATWIWMAHKVALCGPALLPPDQGLQGFVTAAHNVKLAMSAIAAVRVTTYKVDALLGEACLFVGAVVRACPSECRIVNLLVNR
jgi:hypothetical protein